MADPQDPAVRDPSGDAARARLEAQRDELARRLELVLEAARLGWWHYDPIGRRASWDERFRAIFGVAGSEGRADEVLDLVHPDDQPRVWAAVLAAVEPENPQPYSIEYRLSRPDGEQRWVEAHGIATFEGEGGARRATRLVGTVLDITGRKRAERWQAMQHSVTRVLAEASSLADASPGVLEAVGKVLGADSGAVWEVDGRTHTLRCAGLWRMPRPAAAALEPGVGLAGRVWQDARAEAAPGAFAFPILPRREVVGVVELKGPELHEPEPGLRELLGAIGSQLGQFVEHRRSEQQLLQAQKMDAVGQLAGGIAHDFNNLLGVILGYTQLASHDVGPGHKSRPRLDAVHQAATRAAGLTKQILTFSRAQAVETQVCDLNQVVERMEGMLRRLIGEDIRLVVALGDGLGRVSADPGQLEQVIMNLAVNARDAMPVGGRLVLETTNVELDEAHVRGHPDARTGPHVRLTVSDTGEGMAPGTVARIFEPFFTTKELGKGTGLGLAVVFGIVRQAGGSVAVASERGSGSTFNVYLPRVSTLPAARTGATPEAPRGGHETVLVLEDEHALRGIVVETLTEAGYTVLEAAEPSAAVAMAERADSLHLLITDMVLPGQSGPETARQVRRHKPGARVLIISGYPDRLLDGETAGAPGAFLSKPFTIDALLHKVRAVIDAA